MSGAHLRHHHHRPLARHRLAGPRHGPPLHAGAPPVARVDGGLRAIEGAAVLTTEDIEHIVNTLIGAEGYARFDESASTTSASTGVPRPECVRTPSSSAAPWRWHSGSSPTSFLRLTQLGLPSIYNQLVELPQGLVIVTGPRVRARHHARRSHRHHQLSALPRCDHRRRAHRVPPSPQARRW